LQTLAETLVKQNDARFGATAARFRDLHFRRAEFPRFTTSRIGRFLWAIGLAGMRGRRREFGARLEVESDSTGTLIRAVVIPTSASVQVKKSGK
jgi:hypothetical protein